MSAVADRILLLADGLIVEELGQVSTAELVGAIEEVALR